MCQKIKKGELMKRTVETVNVVEYADGATRAVYAFPDTEEGNKNAEEIFTLIAKENGMSDGDTADCIEDGIYEQGDYQVFLIHSEPIQTDK